MSKKLSGAKLKKKRRIEKLEAEKKLLGKVAKISTFFKTVDSDHLLGCSTSEDKSRDNNSQDKRDANFTNAGTLDPEPKETEVLAQHIHI
jgi:hypothetical protein